MTKTWLIAGCSSGVGHHLARAVAARGDRLVATACSPEALQTLGYGIADRKLVAFREDINAWRQVAIGTDFD
ncbi:hypothetical protein [Caballeronia sordidicola]|uniref:hypothetical protein n=1 Tax=Caballeronia sordidicola TaxID=196367 RepID=UPI000A36B8F8|nr:hypothetical protein [Caballeronia sordidicola]